MNTPFIQIVYEEIEEYGLYDHKIKLFNLMEAALNGASGKARKEIDELWLEIQDYKEQLAIVQRGKGVQVGDNNTQINKF